MLIHHGKSKEERDGALKGRYLVIFNAFDMPKSRLIPFSFIHVESFKSEEEVQKWKERIHMDSCLNMMEEKLNRIEEHQLKTEANREESIHRTV
ncbi:unnamed protein product [Caenorhabditis brenneri]